MPFTVAHAMAVIPAVRWSDRLRLDSTCLVIGSMAPDFEYFARGELVSRISHTAVGMLVWNLPATLLLAVLWHAVVKQPALFVLPRGLGRRLAPVFGRPWGATWRVGAIGSLVVSALLGAATHLLWDGVTHANGVIARRLPALETAYIVPGIGRMALHRILQHTSTVVGLVALAWYTARAVRRMHVIDLAPNDAPRTLARLVFGGFLALGLTVMAFRLRRMNIVDPGSLIAGSITGFLAGTLVASVLVRRLVKSARLLDGGRYN